METTQTKSQKAIATIICIEFAGLNTLTDKKDIEFINRIVNHCHEIISSVVKLYGGTVNKLLGDAASISFGISEGVDTAPIRAIGASIEIMHRVDEYTDEQDIGNDLGVKFGVVTGKIISGIFNSHGDEQPTVLGETVNLASRVCDIAERGQILTGWETYEKSKKRFGFHELESLPIKGLNKPFPVFEVTGKIQSDQKNLLKNTRSIQSVMVGRSKEFRQIEKQFMQLLNGRGSVVTVTGKAGIGKSRLIAELKHSELINKVAFYEGRAVSNGKNLSFHPIINVIKSWAGIQEEDDPGVAMRKLASNIHRIYPEAFDEVFPFIATMMGYRLEGKAKERTAGIEGEALENLILKNMRDLLSRAASIRPFVVIIEDAHWCDVSSVIIMESLFKLVQKNRIIFINVFRPGYKETGERLQKFLFENLKTHHTEIQIEPLSKEESDELINNLLLKVKLPEEINSLIVVRAAGNPFFIEEVIRSFIDEGLIEMRDDTFILTENIKYANIPESIDNVILSRIGRLDDKTKDLLRTASVIGRNFYFKVLEEAAQTIEEVDSKLEYLKDVQLINERKQKDEVEYLFKHALAQQATYDSIMEKTKKDLHLKIAGSIEKVFAERIHEFYGTLAHHYGKAEQQEKTEEYLIKAGNESMKSGASSEAVSFLKKGLETYFQNHPDVNPQQVVDLEEKLAFAYFASGQYLEAIEYFDRVQSFYMKPFPKSEFRIAIDLIYHIFLMLRAMYFYNKPEYNTGPIEKKLMQIFMVKGHALTTIDPRRLFIETFYGLRLMKKNKWGSLAASDLVGLSSMLFFVGIAINFGKKLMDFSVQHLDKDFALGTINRIFTSSMYLFFAGKKFDKLEEEKLFDKSIQIGEYWKLSTFYVYNGYSAIESGDETIVRFYLQRLITISEAFDNRFPEIQYYRIKSALYVKYRKMDEAMHVINEALSFASKTEYKMQMMLFFCLQSMAYSILHDYDNARKGLAEAAILLKDFRINICYVQFLIAKSYLEIAELATKPINPAKGRLVQKTAKELIHKAQKVKKNLPEAYRLRAMVFYYLGNPKKALRNFNKSIRAAQSFDGRLELSRTYFEVGKFLQDPKNKKARINGMNATECLLKAKSMFEELNLEWDMEEYEKYMEEGIN